MTEERESFWLAVAHDDDDFVVDVSDDHGVLHLRVQNQSVTIKSSRSPTVSRRVYEDALRKTLKERK